MRLMVRRNAGLGEAVTGSLIIRRPMHTGAIHLDGAAAASTSIVMAEHWPTSMEAAIRTRSS